MLEQKLQHTGREYQGKDVYLKPIERDDRNNLPVVLRNCDYCDSKYPSPVNKLKLGDGKYCSLSCSSKDMHRNRDTKGEKNPAYKGKRDYIEQIKEKGECKNPECNEDRAESLCFHHRNPDEKEATLSRMSQTSEYKLEDVKQEVKKCVLICQNCHAIEHKSQKTTEEEFQKPEIGFNKSDLEDASGTWRGKKLYKKRISGEKHKGIIRNCKKCGQNFFAEKYQVKIGRAKFCSISCSSSFNSSKEETKKQKKKELYEKVRREGQCKTDNCDEDRPVCLTFHHIKQEEKVTTVSEMLDNSYSLSELQDEIEKCIILCRNCHEAIHTTG